MVVILSSTNLFGSRREGHKVLGALAPSFLQASPIFGSKTATELPQTAAALPQHMILSNKLLFNHCRPLAGILKQALLIIAALDLTIVLTIVSIALMCAMRC